MMKAFFSFARGEIDQAEYEAKRRLISQG